MSLTTFYFRGVVRRVASHSKPESGSYLQQLALRLHSWGLQNASPSLKLLTCSRSGDLSFQGDAAQAYFRHQRVKISLPFCLLSLQA